MMILGFKNVEDVSGILKELNACYVTYTVLAQSPFTIRMCMLEYTRFALQWQQDRPYREYTVLEIQQEEAA